MELAQEIVSKNLSARQAETLAKRRTETEVMADKMMAYRHWRHPKNPPLFWNS